MPDGQGAVGSTIDQVVALFEGAFVVADTPGYEPAATTCPESANRLQTWPASAPQRVTQAATGAASAATAGYGQSIAYGSALTATALMPPVAPMYETYTVTSCPLYWPPLKTP